MAIKKTTAVNIYAAKYAVENNLRKPLAMYSLVKAKFNHSIIYGYTHAKLAKITGLDPKTVKRYVKKLKAHYFVEFRDGNLLFRGGRKVAKDLGISHKAMYVDSRPWTRFNSILNRIDYLLIKNNLEEQSYMIARRTGNLNANRLGRKAFVKLRRLISDNGPLDANDDMAEKNFERKNSSRQLGKVLGVSHNKANKIVHELQKKGYLYSREKIVKVKKVTTGQSISNMVRMFNLEEAGYYFTKGGFLNLHKGIEITTMR